MKAVEARIWTIYCGNYNFSDKNRIAPDIGLDRIYVDAGKLYVRETVPEHFQLLYCGSVTRAPTTNALFLCDMFGDQFYIDGQGYDKSDKSTGTANEMFVPAWAVGLAPETKEKKDHEAKPEADKKNTKQVKEAAHSQAPQRVELEYEKRAYSIRF